MSSSDILWYSCNRKHSYTFTDVEAYKENIARKRRIQSRCYIIWWSYNTNVSFNNFLESIFSSQRRWYTKKILKRKDVFPFLYLTLVIIVMSSKLLNISRLQLGISNLLFSERNHKLYNVTKVSLNWLLLPKRNSSSFNFGLVLFW